MIKHAITVTMELGLQLSWADALCIIQDDKDDKVAEITVMGGIYQSAHITISAPGSSSVHQGFLRHRQVPGERGYRFPYMGKGGEIGNMVFVEGRDMEAWEPVDRRAW